MRYRLFYAAFLCSLILPAEVRSQVQKIYLQPSSNAIQKQSQFVDSIRFIPLELKEGIQLNELRDVTITSSYFMVIDFPEKRILLYNKTGAFINQVSYKKLGESFYPEYNEHTNKFVFFGDNRSYSLTSKDRVQIMQDWDNPRNKKYFKKFSIDLADTSFAIKQEQPSQSDIIGANPYYNDYYWSGRINTSPVYKDSLAFELNFYKNNKWVKGFFPYNRINEPRFLFEEENIYLDKSNVPDTCFVTRPFCDTIYNLSKDSLVAAYQVVLPLENTLPASFYKQPFKNKTERENFRRNNGWLLKQVYNFYESQRFILLYVGYLLNGESYIYEKQSKASFKTKNIKPDSSQYNLDLLSNIGQHRNGDKFYKTIKSGDLVAFFEQHKTVPVPKELEAFLKTKPGDDSPVIVEFKFKN